MQREFKASLHGTRFRAIVTIGDVLGRKLLQGVWERGGVTRERFQWTQTRRMKSIFIDGDTLLNVEECLRREGAMPPYALADILEELGWDAGFADVVRNHQEG